MTVLEFLKSNLDNFFSAEEINKHIESNIQTTYAQLRNLIKSSDIVFKEVKAPSGFLMKTYCFNKQTDELQEALHELTYIKQQPKFQFTTSEVVSNLLILKELKKISKLLDKNNII